MARPEGCALTLLVVMVFILVWAKRHWPSAATPRAHLKPTPRPLKPRTPDNCPACRAALLSLPLVATPLKPYSQVKGPRGRKKSIVTAGYACPNPDCLYYNITDDQIHALVGCGGHGSHEYIRDLKCQACQTKFSVRHGTVLYRLKTPARGVGEVLSALARRLECWRRRTGARARRIHDPLLADTRRASRHLTTRAATSEPETPQCIVG